MRVVPTLYSYRTTDPEKVKARARIIPYEQCCGGTEKAETEVSAFCMYLLLDRQPVVGVGVSVHGTVAVDDGALHGAVFLFQPDFNFLLGSGSLLGGGDVVHGGGLYGGGVIAAVAVHPFFGGTLPADLSGALGMLGNHQADDGPGQQHTAPGTHGGHDQQVGILDIQNAVFVHLIQRQRGAAGGKHQATEEAAQIAHQQENGGGPCGGADQCAEQTVGIVVGVFVEFPQRVGVGAVEKTVDQQSKTENVNHFQNILSIFWGVGIETVYHTNMINTSGGGFISIVCRRCLNMEKMCAILTEKGSDTRYGLKGSKVMICSNCGAKLADDVRFCSYCGTAVDAQNAPEPQTSAETRDVYTDIPQEAPKKKKTGLIVAIALILVLLIGGGVGIYLYFQHQANVAAYDEAAALLDAGEYDGALAAFRELGDFRDAAEQIAELEKLQADYDAAKALLKQNKFDEATEAFTALGDYRDSENYVSNEITYQKAQYVKAFADTRDISGLAQVFADDPEVTGLDLSEDEAAAVLYSEAFRLFDGLGQYADAESLASECCREAAMILLNEQYYDEALLLCDEMNEADAAAVKDAYMSHCADSQFLEDIEKAYVVWYDNERLYDFDEEIDKAYAIVEPYTTQHFASDVLKGYMSDFVDALAVMKGVCSGDDVDDWITYYEGMAEIYAIADKLHLDFGVFAGDTDLMESFVGLTEFMAAYPVVEKSLAVWYDALSSVSYDAEGNCYLPYTNDTGYGFTLYVYVVFSDDAGNIVDDSGDIEVDVPVGTAVRIPVKPATITDDEWSSCDLIWWFDVVSLN